MSGDIHFVLTALRGESSLLGKQHSVTKKPRGYVKLQALRQALREGLHVRLIGWCVRRLRTFAP